MMTEEEIRSEGQRLEEQLIRENPDLVRSPQIIGDIIRAATGLHTAYDIPLDDAFDRLIEIQREELGAPRPASREVYDLSVHLQTLNRERQKRGCQ